jgi:HSP20 family protein
MNSEIQTSPIRLIPIDADDPEFLAPNIIRWRVNMKPHLWSPPTDLIETNDRLVIRVEIAGMKKSDFSIHIDQKRVVISGQRAELHEERSFHRMEIAFGEFESDINLPVSIDVDKVSADYKDGFLTINLPKTQPRTIPIQTSHNG